MKCLRLSFIVLFVAAFNSYANAQDKAAKAEEAVKQEQVVLFVCEHGSAKSMVAAAHFNKLASERKLKLRAVARGTIPDQEIAPKAEKGLQADGLTAGERKPKKISKEDVTGAVRVVSFCELPEEYHKGAAVERWNDIPPVSEDYKKSRDAMVERIKRLLNELDPPK